MTSKQKLELTWVGKENRPRLEPRILLEDTSKSYHAAHRVSEDDIFDNRLIFGDNLLALKALEQEFSGKVKCVFIDPPYNTGSAFEHYDDGLEHSIWLGLMRDRLEVIRQLLAEDGSLWITIDDNEAHYLKVLCDEVFGRMNFVANIVWQSKDTPGNNASTISQTHNMVLVFRKSELWKPNLIPRSEKQIANYKNPDDDRRGPWLGTPLTRAEFRERDNYPLKNDAGREVWPPKGSSWRRPPDELKKLQIDRRIYWGKDGNAEFPVEKKFLSEVKDGVVPQTWWPYDFAGSTRNASAEMKGIFEGSKSFDTPKPEKIIQRVFEIATASGDLVLDSFAGSGTTGAVAQKMHRKWIMVEVGDHCHTHIIPRLKKVIDGDDEGGVTEVTNWKGGGGFRYLKLAPSLLEKDRFGREVISKQYNAAMLAEAMCKLEGFWDAIQPGPRSALSVFRNQTHALPLLEKLMIDQYAVPIDARLAAERAKGNGTHGYLGLDGLFYTHESINHGSGEYVRDGVHTNSIESVWAVMKRGLHGVYHHASPKHLDRYVSEFTFRLNDGDVARHTLDRIASLLFAANGKRFTYKALIA